MRHLKRFPFDISSKQCILSVIWGRFYEWYGGDANVNNTCMSVSFFCSPRFGIFNLIHSFLAQSNFISLKIMSVLHQETFVCTSVRTIFFFKKMLYFVILKARKTPLLRNSNSREYSVIFHFPPLSVSCPSVTNLELNRKFLTQVVVYIFTKVLATGSYVTYQVLTAYKETLLQAWLELHAESCASRIRFQHSIHPADMMLTSP